MQTWAAVEYGYWYARSPEFLQTGLIDTLRWLRVVGDTIFAAGVVTTRGHVHWVVTEFGVVNLFGRSLRQRADALISIAHPDMRNELRREFAQTRHMVLG
jgi:hypothetical protein